MKEHSKVCRDAVKETLRTEMVDCAITEDGWTSTATQGFQGQTVHFIDNNFDMNILTLGVEKVDDSHTADKITELSNKHLAGAGIAHEQVVACTHDKGVQPRVLL
jgi:hypothetical protein